MPTKWVVADFFCGSGTTLAAAQKLGRKWIGADVNPAAVKLARERLGNSAYYPVIYCS